MKLSHSFSGSLRQFSYWIANGTVGYPLLEMQSMPSIAPRNISDSIVTPPILQYPGLKDLMNVSCTDFIWPEAGGICRNMQPKIYRVQKRAIEYDSIKHDRRGSRALQISSYL